MRVLLINGSPHKSGNTSVALAEAASQLKKNGIDTDTVWIGTKAGIIVGSPVYYGGPAGSLCALLDRLFYSALPLLANKPAAAVVVCRRGGATAAFNRLNMYFMMSNMPVVTSQYWNMVYGRAQGEAAQDAEGLQTMRTLADNMARMLFDMRDGGRTAPVREPRVVTSFIR